MGSGRSQEKPLTNHREEGQVHPGTDALVSRFSPYTRRHLARHDRGKVLLPQRASGFSIHFSSRASMLSRGKSRTKWVPAFRAASPNLSKQSVDAAKVVLPCLCTIGLVHTKPLCFL